MAKIIRRARVQVGSTNVKNDDFNANNVRLKSSPRPPKGGLAIKMNSRPHSRLFRNTTVAASMKGSVHQHVDVKIKSQTQPMSKPMEEEEAKAKHTKGLEYPDAIFGKEDEVAPAEQVEPWKVPVIPKPKTAPIFPRRPRRNLAPSPQFLRRRVRKSPSSKNSTLSGEPQTPTVSGSRSNGEPGILSEASSRGNGKSLKEVQPLGSSLNQEPFGSEKEETVPIPLHRSKTTPNVTEDTAPSSASNPSLNQQQAKKFDPYEAENSKRKRVKQATIERAKKALQEIAMTRCGNATKFYQLFDADRNEHITFDEFSRGLALYNLDTIFPRSVQSLLFEAIDTDKSGHVDIAELEDFLELGHLTAKTPERVRIATPIEESRDIQELKVKMSTQCREKCPTGSMASHLVKTFRGVDIDNNGFLDPDEVRKCIGPECLNLSLSKEETEKAIEAMSSHGDGVVSFQEFFRWFQYEYNEPTYNVVHNGRAKYMRDLESLVAHMKDPKETADEMKRKERMKDLNDHLFKNALRAQPVPLSPINPERFLTKEPLNPEDGYPNLTKTFRQSRSLETKEKDLPGLDKSLFQRSSKFRLTTPAYSSGDIFKGVRSSQRVPVHHSKLARTRKLQDVMQNTWPSLSLGGAVDPNSSMYGNNMKRFTTTTQEMSFQTGVPAERRSNFDEEIQKKAQTRRFHEESQKLHKERMELGVQLRHDREKQVLEKKKKINATRMLEYLRVVDEHDMWAIRDAGGGGPSGFSKRPNFNMTNRIFGSQVVT
mmetsp:Transcript_32006/g.40130  ORF Transcript_32006/g.40130 Transcript_32006/m.40130 type:complete len:767 (-) Transcript_32006:183-2483(-)